MRNFSFTVTNDVLDLGVKIVTARISGVKTIKSSSEIDDFITKALIKIKQQWVGKNWKDDPILQGFRQLHTKDGTDIFFIIQGNEKTTAEYVKNSAKDLCEFLTKFLGGTYTFLN